MSIQPGEGFNRDQPPFARGDSALVGHRTLQLHTRMGIHASLMTACAASFSTTPAVLTIHNQMPHASYMEAFHLFNDLQTLGHVSVSGTLCSASKTAHEACSRHRCWLQHCQSYQPMQHAQNLHLSKHILSMAIRERHCHLDILMRALFEVSSNHVKTLPGWQIVPMKQRMPNRLQVAMWRVKASRYAF